MENNGNNQGGEIKEKIIGFGKKVFEKIKAVLAKVDKKLDEINGKNFNSKK